MKFELDQMTREVMREIERIGIQHAQLLTLEGELYRYLDVAEDGRCVWLLDVNTEVHTAVAE